MEAVKCTENWQVKLDADPDLLEKLSGEFRNPELRIFHNSDCWYLESIHLDSNERSEIYRRGEELIEYLNHALWLYAYRPASIKSNGYCLLIGGKEPVIQFLAIGPSTAPTRLIVYSNDIPSRDSLDLFSQHDKAREALAFFNNVEIDWFTLYKIYETTRDDESDISTTKDGIALIEKWAGVDENKRFFETANWQRHSVFGKTHGKPNKPAENPMSLSEAKRFIRTLLIKWLEHKATIKHKT